MSDIEFKMSLDEAVSIVNLLGSLPTAQGAYPLFQKLKDQITPLLQQPEEPKK